ncbi:hypothetical protein BCR34DRAFT_238973 [Clohesyomyces aquaticus]|uniref:Uncharacterized protein n=1 Tax=Clohesyomyces aquaticus TaxID=1231657 RepID=A0A1Y1ZVT4_9PLEO|nr:hypothetical protein BCR34DRAFT_238973 [Clohesyomyces aquaticus]
MADYIQWIFPPAPSNISSSRNFTAQNATFPNEVFGKSPVYVNDVILLSWNSSKKLVNDGPSVQYECGISPNGSRSRAGPGQVVGKAQPTRWTFQFLRDSSPDPPSTNPPSNSGPAQDICVFFSYDSENQIYYPSTAFEIINTTRQPQSYLYTVDSPAGSTYTDVGIQKPQKKDNSKLGAILGSVLGTLFLLAVVVAAVFWWRRRAARRNGQGKVMVVEEDTELQRVERPASVAATLPPAYDEHPREAVEPVGGAESRKPVGG